MNSKPIIGSGNTAAVYEWGEDKILKLFFEGYPSESVEQEFHNAVTINPMDFVKPRAYEIISFDGRDGIIYDRVEGKPLDEWVMQTNDLQQCAIYMARLHKTILRQTAPNIANYKDFLKHHIPDEISANPDKYNELLQQINHLPDGDTLCHGDFHPGNILLSNETATVIDFMNLCHGTFLYDVARTVFLVEYTPVPESMKDREQILYHKKVLTDLYLSEMNVTREMLQDYLSVIAIIRKDECPDE